MQTYTDEKTEFKAKLLEENPHLTKDDIYTKFVTGGVQIVWPVIGKDGKPHLEKKTFKK